MHLFHFRFAFPHCTCVLSNVRLFVTPWTVEHPAPLSMGFPRQEYWSGVPFPSPEDLPDPGMEPTSLASPALTGGFFTIGPSPQGIELNNTPNPTGSTLGTSVAAFGCQKTEVNNLFLSLKSKLKQETPFCFRFHHIQGIWQGANQISPGV